MTAQINVEIAPAEVLRDQLRLSDDDNEIDLELAVDLYGEAVAKALPLNYDIVAPKGGRCLVPAWNGYQFWTVSLGTLATCDGEDDKAQVRGVLETADDAGFKAAQRLPSAAKPRRCANGYRTHPRIVGCHSPGRKARGGRTGCAYALCVHDPRLPRRVSRQAPPPVRAGHRPPVWVC
jgi:hypothetical protein